MGGEYGQEEFNRWEDRQRRNAIAERDKRIQQLEKLNAALAAEVDRMRVVVEAARDWFNGASNWSVTLAKAVATYEQSSREVG
jgi:hypothetical protein